MTLEKATEAHGRDPLPRRTEPCIGPQRSSKSQGTVQHACSSHQGRRSLSAWGRWLAGELVHLDLKRPSPEFRVQGGEKAARSLGGGWEPAAHQR